MSLGLRVVNGDIAWSGGVLRQVTDPLDAIRQLLECRLRMAVGEWFLDPAEGLPVYESIMGKPRTEAGVRQVIRDRILQTLGVLALPLLKVSIDPAARTVAISFQAQTAAGVVTGGLQV
jgi:hypothetical protein